LQGQFYITYIIAKRGLGFNVIVAMPQPRVTIINRSHVLPSIIIIIYHHRRGGGGGASTSGGDSRQLALFDVWGPRAVRPADASGSRAAVVREEQLGAADAVVVVVVVAAAADADADAEAEAEAGTAAEAAGAEAARAGAEAEAAAKAAAAVEEAARAAAVAAALALMQTRIVFRARPREFCVLGLAGDWAPGLPADHPFLRWNAAAGGLVVAPNL
jgi:hypothetical protein